MFCSKCGKELPQEAIFCPFCGNKKIGEIEQTYVKEKNQTKMGIWKKVIAIATVVIVGFGAWKAASVIMEYNKVYTVDDYPQMKRDEVCEIKNKNLMKHIQQISVCGVSFEFGEDSMEDVIKKLEENKIEYNVRGNRVKVYGEYMEDYNPSCLLELHFVKKGVDMESYELNDETVSKSDQSKFKLWALSGKPREEPVSFMDGKVFTDHMYRNEIEEKLGKLSNNYTTEAEEFANSFYRWKLKGSDKKCDFYIGFDFREVESEDASGIYIFYASLTTDDNYKLEDYVE